MNRRDTFRPYFDAISASEAAIARLPTQAISVPHTRAVCTVSQCREVRVEPTGPPFKSPAWNETATDSHEA